jgi:hypothetical protein
MLQPLQLLSEQSAEVVCTKRKIRVIILSQWLMKTANIVFIHVGGVAFIWLLFSYATTFFLDEMFFNSLGI